MSVASPVIDHLDPAARLIYLAAGIREYHPVEDIYREIIHLRATDDTYQWFQAPVIAKGSEPKGGGKYTSRYAVFRFGWKVVPEDVTHSLYVSGEQITDDGQSGAACLDLTVLSPGVSVFVHYEPPSSELVKAENELIAIKRMAFDGAVYIYLTTGTTGTAWPQGTASHPVNNLADALAIAVAQGLDTLHIRGSFTLQATDVVSGYTLEGDGATFTNSASQVIMISGCVTANTTFKHLEVSGRQGGEGNFVDCVIGAITNSHCDFQGCKMEGPLELVNSGWTANHNTTLHGCYTSEKWYEVDYNHSPINQVYSNFSGRIKFRNITNPQADLLIQLDSGRVWLDESCTAGTVTISGTGVLVDESNGASVTTDGLMSKETVSAAVWDEPIGSHAILGSIGQTLVFSEFDSMVHLNVLQGSVGTEFPHGTHQHPVNNIIDMMAIEAVHGFRKARISGAIVLDRGFDGYSFLGDTSFISDSIDMNGQELSSVRFEDLRITGEMHGTNVSFMNCFLAGVKNASGEITGGRLTGDITVHPGDYLSGIEIVVEGDFTTIDLQSTAGTTVSLDVNSGIITFLNAVEGCLIELNLRGGEIVLDASCTGGIFYAEGYGTLYNESTMEILDNHLLALETIPGPVWEQAVEEGYSAQSVMKIVAAVLAGKVNGAGTGIETFRSIDDAADRVVSTVDSEGNRTAVETDVS
jgi:hypothetical protein